jgi:hypothetical protein
VRGRRSLLLFEQKSQHVSESSELQYTRLHFESGSASVAVGLPPQPLPLLALCGPFFTSVCEPLWIQLPPPAFIRRPPFVKWFRPRLPSRIARDPVPAPPRAVMSTNSEFLNEVARHTGRSMDMANVRTHVGKTIQVIIQLIIGDSTIKSLRMCRTDRRCWFGHPDSCEIPRVSPRRNDQAKQQQLNET